jgi:hypothetical protein
MFPLRGRYTTRAGRFANPFLLRLPRPSGDGRINKHYSLSGILYMLNKSVLLLVDVLAPNPHAITL